MRLRAIVLAFAATVLLAGCATFSLPGRDTVYRQDDTSAEAVFRRQAQTFQEHFAEAGWLREEERKSRVRAFLSILSKGWGKSKTSGDEKDAKSKDAASLYLARLKGELGDTPIELALGIQRDLGQALIAMAGLNDLVEPLIDPEAGLTPKALRTDMMMLERVLISASKAQSLFIEANARIKADLEAAIQDQMTAHVLTNARQIHRMKEFADTLNTHRLQNRPVG